MIEQHSCNYSIVGTRVRKLLAENGASQSDLARDLNVTRSLISQKMHGTTSFTIRDLGMIADRFNVSIDWLLGRERTEASHI